MTIRDDCFRLRAIYLVPLFSVMLAAIFGFSTPAFSQEHTKVIHNHASEELTLTRADILQIFTGSRQYWPDGSKITLFMLDSDSPLHQQFSREHLRMFPYQLDRVWNQMTYSGQGEPPRKMDDEMELINAVMTTPGAIGYATESGITEYRDRKAGTQ